jgi:periplasmic divalent cation tolerance protein
LTECCQVTTTLPDQAAAERVAADLIEKHLAACAQVVGPVSTTYRWQGKVERAHEWFCILKTTLQLLPRLEQRIRELHPYDIPEVIALAILAGDERYLDWIRAETNGDDSVLEVTEGSAGSESRP